MEPIIPIEEPFVFTFHNITPAIRIKLRQRPGIRSTCVYKLEKKGNVVVKLFCPGKRKRRRTKSGADAPPPYDNDMASIDFPNDMTIALGIHSRRYFVFDMEDEVRSHLFRLLALCQSQDKTGPALVEAVQAADAAMLAETGLSALGISVLREVLFLAARGGWELQLEQQIKLRSRNSRRRLASSQHHTPATVFPETPRPAQEDLILCIARAGPPSDLLFTTMVRKLVDETGTNKAHPFFHGDVEAALIYHGWRNRDRHDGILALARCGDGAEALRGDKELLVTLEGVGQLATPHHKSQALQAIAARGSPELMRWALGRIPLVRLTQRQECFLLPAAAATRGGRTSAHHHSISSRVGMVTLLLEMGLDPNRVNYPDGYASATSVGRNPLALHAAIKSGEARVVELLLSDRGGATMVPDEHGKTPLDMAHEKGTPRKVKLLEDWLDERGLPHDHVDEPNVVDEEEDEMPPPRVPSPEDWRTDPRYRGKWFLFHMFWRQLMKKVPRYGSARR